MRRQYMPAGNIASIYGLVDPREPGAVRYVGATRRTLDVRLRGHEYNAIHGVLQQGKAYRYPVHDWIAELLEAEIHPAIFLIDRVHRSLRAPGESYWIQCFRHHGADLLNEAMPRGNPLTYVALLEARVEATGTWEYAGKATLLRLDTAA